MERGTQQQVYDEDVRKKWNEVLLGYDWVDYIGQVFGGEIAAWASDATEQELTDLANVLMILRFSKA